MPASSFRSVSERATDAFTSIGSPFGSTYSMGASRTTANDSVSLPRFRGHPNSHESAIGGCHGKAEAEEAAIVLAGVQGGDGPVGAGEREEPRDDRPGARSHRDSAARLGAAG